MIKTFSLKKTSNTYQVKGQLKINQECDSAFEFQEDLLLKEASEDEINTLTNRIRYLIKKIKSTPAQKKLPHPVFSFSMSRKDGCAWC